MIFTGESVQCDPQPKMQQNNERKHKGQVLWNVQATVQTWPQLNCDAILCSEEDS